MECASGLRAIDYRDWFETFNKCSNTALQRTSSKNSCKLLGIMEPWETILSDYNFGRISGILQVHESSKCAFRNQSLSSVEIPTLEIRSLNELVT